MNVKIPYGKTMIDFECNGHDLDVINVPVPPAYNGSENRIVGSLHHPINADSINTFINKKDKILIVVSDATRYTASEKIIPLLLWELAAQGVERKNIEFIVSLGMHRPPTHAEIKNIIGEETASQFKVSIHKAFENNNMKYLGMTKRNTPVYVNKILYRFDKIIIISSIGYHYFAGFSGGRKSLIPGLASIDTIKANHKLVIQADGSGKNQHACLGKLYDNPVHEDLMEAAQKMTVPVFCIHSIIFQKKLIEVLCGDLSISFKKACEKFASIARADVNERRELVIASCGGYPRDISVIQSLKSLENASCFCKKGGVIIFLAQCRGGWGNKEFANWLSYTDPKIFQEKLSRHYAVNGQPAYTWRIRSLENTLFMVTDLPASFQEKLNATFFPDLPLAYETARKQLNPPHNGYVIPYSWEIVPGNREWGMGRDCDFKECI